MKRIFVVLLALFLCVGGIGIMHITSDKDKIPAKKFTAFAEEVIEYEEEGTESENVYISVIGNSSKKLNPDSAVIFASLQNFDVDKDQSKDLLFSSFDEIKNSLSEVSSKISLDYFSSYPNFRHRFSGELIGSSSFMNFSIQIDSLEDLKSVVEGLIEKNASINNIEYKVSNIDDEYNELLNSAVENAKSKALKLLNRESVSIVSIREESLFSSCSYSKQYFENDDASAGEIEINARVKVLFK